MFDKIRSLFTNKENENMKLVSAEKMLKTIRESPSVDELLQAEEYFNNLNHIMEYLQHATLTPIYFIPMHTDMELGDSLYHSLSDILTNEYVLLTAFDEKTSNVSKEIMRGIRSIESKCVDIDAVDNKTISDENKYSMKKDLWFDYLKEWERNENSVDVFCMLSKKGNKYMSSLV